MGKHIKLSTMRIFNALINLLQKFAANKQLQEAVEELNKTIERSKQISEDVKKTIEHSEQTAKDSRETISKVRKNNTDYTRLN